MLKKITVSDRISTAQPLSIKHYTSSNPAHRVSYVCDGKSCCQWFRLEIRPNTFHRSIFIDLIFTSQPSMIMDSGVHPSLHSNCHHHIIYAKFDLDVFYPPPYERTVWYFSWANSDHIKKVIDQFD